MEVLQIKFVGYAILQQQRRLCEIQGCIGLGVFGELVTRRKLGYM